MQSTRNLFSNCALLQRSPRAMHYVLVLFLHTFYSITMNGLGSLCICRFIHASNHLSCPQGAWSTCCPCLYDILVHGYVFRCMLCLSNASNAFIVCCHDIVICCPRHIQTPRYIRCIQSVTLPRCILVNILK
jgi:hypothetical protein